MENRNIGRKIVGNKKPGIFNGQLFSVDTDESMQISRRHKPDYWLLVFTIALMLFGLILIFSISPALSITNNVSSNYFTYKQALADGLGFVAFFIALKIPIVWWKKMYKYLIGLAAITTAAAIALPVNPNYPAHRWVRLGSLSFQSVEIVKFAIIIWLAGFLGAQIKKGTIKNIKAVLIPLVSVLFILGIIVVGIQSDLGSIGVITAAMIAMAYTAGFPLKRLSLIGLIILAGAVLAIISSPYRLARVEAYIHPQTNCQGSGYQACQSLIAVGSGGIIGLGLGKTIQAYGYVPEASNDSIFAIYSEKFGFIGDFILIAIFFGFFYRIKLIAESIEDSFLKLVVVGILIWLCTQTLINIGAMIGLFPLKGITLPFISYGGTSIIFSAAAVGLVFEISRYTSLNSLSRTKTKKGISNESSFDRRRIRGAYHSRSIDSQSHQKN